MQDPNEKAQSLWDIKQVIGLSAIKHLTTKSKNRKKAVEIAESSESLKRSKKINCSCQTPEKQNQ